MALSSPINAPCPVPDRSASRTAARYARLSSTATPGRAGESVISSAGSTVTVSWRLTVCMMLAIS